ncbi:MAG: hypothetical protein EA370_12955 [Wenzhouxiangella sp.]|nr:MAG: hypothetical protein EA370_12955 [Wenzhouxiangella sp.]
MNPIIFILFATLASSAFGNPPSDPTRPPSAQEIRAFLGQDSNAAEPEVQRWQLQSILIADQRRIAIINGRRVSEGDRFDAAEVLTIEPGRVELRHRTETIVLTLASRRTGGHHE